MELIRITRDNLETEHVCCAMSGGEAETKKAWLAERFGEGLVFLKGNVRGKCFIEYIPAEQAWAPILADGFIYINCLWVSGQFKGHGYSNLLLDECIRDSREKGKYGLVILSSEKKRGFLADPSHLTHKGFQVCDTASPYFTLMVLPFDQNADKPRFREQVKTCDTDKKGFTVFYTDQCPFTAKYVPILARLAKQNAVPFETVHLTSARQAQNGYSPYSTFSLFYNGRFLTHEIPSEKKFEKILKETAHKI